MSVTTNTGLLSAVDVDSPSQDQTGPVFPRSSVSSNDSFEELASAADHGDLASSRLIWSRPSVRDRSPVGSIDLLQPETVDDVEETPRKPPSSLNLGRRASHPVIDNLISEDRMMRHLQGDDSTSDGGFTGNGDSSRRGSKTGSLAPLSTLLRSSSKETLQSPGKSSTLLRRFLGMSLNRKVRDINMTDLGRGNPMFASSNSLNALKTRGVGKDRSATVDPFAGYLSEIMLEEVS